MVTTRDNSITLDALRGAESDTELRAALANFAYCGDIEAVRALAALVIGPPPASGAPSHDRGRAHIH